MTQPCPSFPAEIERLAEKGLSNVSATPAIVLNEKNCWLHYSYDKQEQTNLLKCNTE